MALTEPLQWMQTGCGARGAIAQVRSVCSGRKRKVAESHRRCAELVTTGSMAWQHSEQQGQHVRQ